MSFIKYHQKLGRNLRKAIKEGLPEWLHQPMRHELEWSLVNYRQARELGSKHRFHTKRYRTALSHAQNVDRIVRAYRSREFLMAYHKAKAEDKNGGPTKNTNAMQT